MGAMEPELLSDLDANRLRFLVETVDGISFFLLDGASGPAAKPASAMGLFCCDRR